MEVANGEGFASSPHLEDSHMVADTLNMRDLIQWLCWRIEERDGKPTKVPYDPSTGEKAESTNPKTWTSYEKAVSVCKDHGYEGIGFVFTPEDDLCGVDLDKCLDPETGELEGWAREVIEELDSYTEISPSGTGVHVLVRATLPEGRNRKGRFEAYDRGRYFTVIGKHLPGTPQTIEVRQEALQSVVRRVFGEESTNGHTKPVAAAEPVDNGLSDSEVLRKAIAASNGARFSRLWNGDTEEYGSHSEADLALCGMLAFWTGGDAARIDTLFRQSGLYRKKWDRNDYRNRTITEALNGKTEFYEAPRSVEFADGTEGKAEEKEERRNQADRLIGYALEDVQELFVDQHGAPHGLIDGEPVPLTSRCYSWLRRLMWEEEGRSVSGEYLKMAAGTLSAHAEFSGESRELYTRAAWHEGVLYYELRPGKVVRVGPGGWTFEAKPPVLFRRYVNLKALPDPEAGGSLDLLDGLVNLKSERDRRLFKAYLATLPLEHLARPIFNASGAMGSGKTTIGRVAKRTWDPTAPETVRFDPRDFLQKAMHAYIVMLDNQNTIPEWASDTLCRLVTGEADSKRRLYTDDEDVIIELRRAVILNGINVPTERGDVLDRSLVVELERIPDAERKTEEQIWERFEEEHAKLLGALFDVLSRAIAFKPSIKLSRRPRLADWGEYAAAVYEVMGWGSETFLNDWDEVVRVQNQATLDGSPVAQAIIKFMEDEEEYTATSSELHSKLKVVAATLGVDVERDKAWPKSARWLWRRIKEVLSLLVAAGIEASRGRDESAKQITLRKIPTNDGSDGSRVESRTDKGETHAITNVDDGRSNGSGGANGRSNGSEKPSRNAASANNADTANRYGDFSGEVSTLERTERIRRLVEEGMSETWAQRTVLADGHPLDCGCEVCL
jgi:putative DNA primase/helicase